MKRPSYEELEQRIKELEEKTDKARQIEERLRASEERLTLALEATSDGIWDWDIINSRTYASSRCEEILGLTGNPVPMKTADTWSSRIHPDDYERVSKMLLDHLAGKAPFDVEYRHRHESGEYRWQSSRGMALFDKDGNPYRMVGSIRDISERKRAEEERVNLEARLKQAQKMEALGALAGGVAHDFNNLLTAILGNIDLSLLYVHKEEKASKNLLKAKKACKRAKDLTRQFMTFAKGIEPVKKTGPIGKLVRDSANLALAGSNTRCDFSVADDLWQVDYDSEQMKQAIGNLIVNASDAMHEEGVVEIVAENFHSGQDSNQRYKKQVKISVTDHGKGMPQDVIEKIFDPYYSSKDGVTKKGMGLGLSICYSIIEKHGGRIEVKSEVGVGTAFEIYLPASEI
ncbi:putative Histidine kinase [uncultured Desulfobacterium sp.]|uniref:histidine kinase n=1 Tax=uncultured Desulfobacterium sp. TaxID=201089 RepID=A0A445MQV6_9BACT|nr:putative Histidine kinase [uncultured Desulfobacterium sp.]